MTVKIKDRATAEAVATFRTQADAIRTRLKDATIKFSSEDLKAAQTELADLESRAATVAGFTPDAEIEDQGGVDARFIEVDGDRREEQRSREAGEHRGTPETRALRKQVISIRNRVDDAFGGPNAMILALARRKEQPLDGEQRKVMLEIAALSKRVITAETGGDSGTEYLLPLQQESSIFQLPNQVNGILATARRFTMRGRTLRIPFLKQTDAEGSNRPMAGIADVQIIAEAGDKTEFEPKFGQQLMTAYKYAGYTELGDETFEDDMTGELAPTIQNVIGGQIVNTFNEHATIDGTGDDDDMPLGAFNEANDSLILVPRKTASTITFDDVLNMYAHHLHGSASRWYVTPSAIPKLFGLTLTGTTLITFIPNMQGLPQMSLLGIPIVVTPILPLLGSQADLCLGNGEFYGACVRKALTIESSIHYKFRKDVTAYRFYMRCAGIPIPDGTYSYKADNSVKEWEISPFVALDNAVAS